MKDVKARDIQIAQLQEILRRRNAEIEQLKENYSISLDANQERREKIEVQAKLITELADGFVDSHHNWIDPKYKNLINRAREDG